MNQPLKLGIYVLRFPVRSETFIVTKVLGLLERGFDVQIFAMSASADWDRFAIPRPFSRVRCVSSHPIHVPPKLGKEELEVYVRTLDANLEHATTVAENWAKSGIFDPLGYQPPSHALVNPEHHKAWPSQRLLGRG